MWNSDIGYVKKFYGSHTGGFFNDLADKLYKKGVLAVFCLREGCVNCEKLMVMIENINQNFVKRPVNLVIIWGVKTSKVATSGNKSVKIRLGDSTPIPIQGFMWEKLPTHGFALVQSSVNYLMFEGDHSPKIFGGYLKKIYRRMQYGIMTTNENSVAGELNNKKASACIIEYPQNYDEQKLFKLEHSFVKVMQKHKFVPYFFEGSTENIQVLNNGNTVLNFDGFDLNKFYSSFKKSL